MISFIDLFLVEGTSPPQPYPTQQPMEQPTKPGIMNQLKSAWETTKSVAPMGALAIGLPMTMIAQRMGGVDQARIPTALSTIGDTLSMLGSAGMIIPRLQGVKKQAQTQYQQNLVKRDPVYAQQYYQNLPPR